MKEVVHFKEGIKKVVNQIKREIGRTRGLIVLLQVVDLQEAGLQVLPGHQAEKLNKMFKVKHNVKKIF